MIIKDEEIIRNNHLLSELRDYIMQKFIEIDKQKKNNLKEVKKILYEEKLTVLYTFPEDKKNKNLLTNKKIEYEGTLKIYKLYINIYIFKYIYYIK